MFNDQTSAAPAAEAAPATPSAEQLEHLLVLSQAPLSLDEALAEEAAAEAVDEPRPMTWARLAAGYAEILALFVGVGLVTASVRHLSSAPKLYLALGAAGAVLFAAGATSMNAGVRRGGVKAMAAFAGASLLLGLGLGLLVGGILHFSAFPHTGAVLVPLGMVLSFAGHALRSGRELLGRSMMSPAITLIGIVVWVGIGLGVAAKKIDPKPVAAQTGHGAAAGAHGDSGAAAEGAHGAAPAAEHGATSTAAAGEDHTTPGAAAGAEHGEAAAAGAEHGEAAAKAEHGEAAAKAEHGEAAAKAEHGETAAAASHDAGH